MENNEDNLRAFIEITGDSDEEKCKNFLIKSNWSLERAIESYFNEQSLNSQNYESELGFNNVQNTICEPPLIVSNTFACKVVNYLKKIILYPLWLIISVFQASFIHSFLFVKSFFLVRDETQSFIESFENCFGRIHPKLLTLKTDELQKIEKETKKPILFYVDDVNSHKGQLFCRNILCNSSLSKFIDDNFNFAPFDLSTNYGRNVIDKYNIYYLPWIKVISLSMNRNFNMPIHWTVYSNVGDFKLQLENVINQFKVSEVTSQNTNIRSVQEQEYLTSLEQDKLKKIALNKKMNKKHLKVQIEKLKNEITKKAIHKITSINKMDLSSMSSGQHCSIQIRYSNGKSKKHKLPKSMTIQQLCYYLINDGLFNENYFKRTFSLYTMLSNIKIATAKIDTNHPDYLNIKTSNINTNSNDNNNNTSIQEEIPDISLENFHNQTLNLTFDSDTDESDDCCSNE